MLDRKKSDAYAAILKEELLMATGCTEPIAIAYCAARMRTLLGKLPERVTVEVSGNIVKNVKSVIVPNTGGLKGIEAAAAAGIVAGDADKVLQVISFIPEEKHAEIADFAKNVPMDIICMETPRMLEIRITGCAGDNTAVCHIANNHSNIVYEARNGEVLIEKELNDNAEDSLQDKSVLNVKDIVEYADTVDLSVT